jgi:carbon storage regulator CsrA
MLVLSRKEDQKVLIPGLDISIKVIRCKNSSVTLGFDAPPEIRIARDELSPEVSVKDPAFSELIADKISSYPAAQRHDIRDQFNVVTMALQMLIDDIEAGELHDVDEVYERVCQRLRDITATPNDREAFALVVEDQANERELLAGILRMNGYRVATAADGNEALKYLEENATPAFILVDMHMPGCDGVELVQQIRSSVEWKDVNVYVVSGADKDDCELAPDSINGWYTKPLAPQELIRALASN